MKKVFLIIFGLALFAVSCRKKDKTTPAQKTYLAKEVFQSTGSRTWTYDAQNKLINIEFASTNETSNPSFNFRVIGLDAFNRVVNATIDYVNPVRGDIKVVNVFGTDGKLLSETETDATTNTLLSSYSFQHTPTQVTATFKNGSGVIQFYDVYTLSSDGKNVTKRDRFNSSSVLSFSDVFSGFDNKKSAQSAFVPGFSVSISSANNFTTQVQTLSSGLVTTYTYTYEYNNDGYATKRISASGAISGYEYIKK